MKNRTMRHIWIVGILMLLLTPGCKNDGGAQQMVAPEVSVIVPIQKDVPIKRDFVGQAFGLLDIPIRARVEGFLEGIFFDEGFPVKRGQLLYTIDPQPFRAEVAAQQSNVAEAQTYLVNAKNELARYEPLAKINAVSKSDLDAAIARRDAAEASLRAAEANLEMAEINLSYTRIISPIDGLIGKTEARTGEFVGKDPNPVILNTVSRIDTMRVQFFLTEGQYLAIAREFRRVREVVELKSRTPSQNVDLILADGSLYDHKGAVDFVGRNIDPKTGSIIVQASFSNPDGLIRPGAFSKVRIEFDVLEGALLVPQRCVMELQGQMSVYIVDEDNVVQSRQVSVGDRIGDLWLIREGLNPGDQVILDGIQRVRSGVPVVPELTEFESKSPETM